MFLVGLLQWWYGRGWVSQVALFKEHLAGISSFFSIGQLAGTLFAPFRQISVGAVNGSVGVQLRAFFDKTLSRCIGAIVRLFTIFAGIMTLVVSTIVESLLLAIWLLLPAFPVIGGILLAIGWVPQWI